MPIILLFMKKIFLPLILLFFLFNMFCQNVPENLIGIWEGDDRYVFFEQNDNNRPQIVIVYKEYYGWYLDRAVEPLEYKNLSPKARNLATPKESVQIYLDFEKAFDFYDDNDVIQLVMNYSASQKEYIPVFINDDLLYLDFYVQSSQETSYYLQISPAKFIGESENYQNQNIYGLYFSDDGIFRIRYWLSDMEHNSDIAVFDYKRKNYNIPKHIYTAHQNYSCTSGRGKRIRNLIAPKDNLNKTQIFNSSGTVFSIEKPYLKKLADKKTFLELVKIVNEQNAKRKPDPAPLFPVKTYYDIINELTQQKN